MLRQAYWLVWSAGTILILLSWAGVVSPTVGWAGFAVACGAAFLSYLPRRAAPRTGAGCAVLTRAMTESKDRGYRAAIEHLRRGGRVFYDGMTLGVCPGNELWLAVVASAPVEDLDEMQVHREVERARAGLEALARCAPEVAGITSGRRLRVSLISEYGANGGEVCRVTDGHVEWMNKGKPTDRLG